MPTLWTDGRVERHGFRKCPTIIINILLFKHHDIDVHQYFVKILPENNSRILLQVQFDQTAEICLLGMKFI